MNSSSSHLSDDPKPKRLKILASSVKFPGGNNLLHQFVIDNSRPNQTGSVHYVNAVLLSMSDAPANVVNAWNNDGWSALHLAVLKKNLLMVRKIISCIINIDVHARCRTFSNNGCRRNTALHIASRLGHSSIIRALLDKGAGIDKTNSYDETPLCYALRSRDLDAVKLLVSQGASVNQVCGWDPPLCRAASSGNLEAVEFLVRSGAEVNFGDGCSPLWYAAESGNLAVVEFLVSNGADVNIKSGSSGESLLQRASRSASLEIVECLVRNGADINVIDRKGKTLLHYAVISRTSENAAFLLDQGVDIGSRDQWGRTPLQDAVWLGNLECATFLLDQGADLKGDNFGWTPLHVAACQGHVDIVRALLDKGAAANAKNIHGKTPLDLARENRNKSCMDVLKNVR